LVAFAMGVSPLWARRTGVFSDYAALVHESKRNAKHPSHDFHRDTTLGDEESRKGAIFI
jgi:hypothetical protein